MPAGKRWGAGVRMDDPDKGKEMLLRAAVDCLITKGLKNTTVEDVAARANVTRRTVYRYYSGKRDIIEAVFAYGRTLMFSRMREAVAQYEDDFPRYLEECIVFAVTYYQPRPGNIDLVSGDNLPEAIPFITSEEANREWRDSLAAPYRRYAEAHPEVGSLDDLIEFIGRLVVGYRHAPTSERRLRAQLRALHLLA